ncbi:MAG: terminase [Muricauda sp. TMED12]|nr:MAG: terminase [Muricauda sp. TMED12]
MSSLDKLSKNLGKTLQTVVEEPAQSIPATLNKDVVDDYQFSREKYRELITKGSGAMDGMLELAAESEHPRAYEVLSNMMKNMADMTDKLMALQKSKDDLENKKAVLADGTVTQNNVFIGSTTDLQRMLRSEDVIDVKPK